MWGFLLECWQCSEIDCGDACRTLNILVLKAIELHTINGWTVWCVNCITITCFYKKSHPTPPVAITYHSLSFFEVFSNWIPVTFSIKSHYFDIHIDDSLLNIKASPFLGFLCSDDLHLLFTWPSTLPLFVAWLWNNAFTWHLPIPPSVSFSCCNYNLALIEVGSSFTSTPLLPFFLLYQHPQPPSPLSLSLFSLFDLNSMPHHFSLPFYLNHLANPNPLSVQLSIGQPSHWSHLHYTLHALNYPFTLLQKPLSSSPRFRVETCFSLPNPSPLPFSKPADNFLFYISDKEAPSLSFIALSKMEEMSLLLLVSLLVLWLASPPHYSASL